MIFTASHAFTFDAPAGFVMIKQAGNSYPIFASAPSNYNAYMQMASDGYNGNLQSFVENELRGFIASPSLTNAKVLASGLITTKTAVKGIRVLMSFGSAKGPMEMAAYYFQKPGEVEVLHAFCLAPMAQQFVPLFDNSANTIVLLK